MNDWQQSRGVDGVFEDFWINAFKQVNRDFPSIQQQLALDDCTTGLCDGLSSFDDASSLGYTDSDHPYQSFLDDLEIMNYSEVSPVNCLQLTDSTPYWKDTTKSDLAPSTPTQFFLSTLYNLEAQHHNEGAWDVHPLKRPRIGTPSPLPTFKVRKDKFGDRITALQQLVSPFGKTDTASVLHEAIEYIKLLHEAIEYIKLLHDQLNVLGSAYLKNVAPSTQLAGKLKDHQEVGKHDLGRKGLCLVPISKIFPVASLGGSFR